MNETWAVLFGTNSVAIQAGELQVRPGLGRHQLVIPIQVRPTHESADGHDLSFAGSVSARSLRGAGGYLGRIHPTSPRRIAVNTQLDEYLHVDIDPRQIAVIESYRDGGFALDLQIEIVADSGASHGSATISGHAVSRETWLSLLEQMRYQRTLLLELPAPDNQATPQLAKAVSYFANAQRRFLEGDNRLALEAIRQSLAALANQDPNAEDAAEAVIGELKSLRFGEAQFVERFDLVRRAAKLLSDLAAHPEVAETGPHEVRSAILIAGGLLQWYTAESGVQR
ncbi:MAG TPA: hypothetical protein VHB02_08045 [Acidimicrobiales bacterium]|nr:hypothetical protein [Acidimicrobiales bacterium]